MGLRLEDEMFTDILQGLEMLRQSLAGHMSGGSETSQAMVRLDNVVLQEKLDYLSGVVAAASLWEEARMDAIIAQADINEVPVGQGATFKWLPFV